MADSPTIRRGSDRERINVNQEHELRHWSKKLDTTLEQCGAITAGLLGRLGIPSLAMPQ